MIDFINSTFIFIAMILAFGNVHKLYKDKKSSGLTLMSQVFFMIWAIWSVYFFYSIDKYMSMTCEILLLVAAITYVLQMIYYGRNK